MDAVCGRRGSGMNKDKIQTLIEIEEDYDVPLGYVVINRDNWHELAVTGFKLLSENKMENAYKRVNNCSIANSFPLDPKYAAG